MPSENCRVCGLLYSAEDAADLPWGEDGDSPSYGFCDCCGVEFGYGDSTPAGARRWRTHWLETAGRGGASRVRSPRIGTGTSSSPRSRKHSDNGQGTFPNAGPGGRPVVATAMMKGVAESEEGVWVFNGDGGRFAGGVFASRERAEAWITDNELDGVLTLYPLDVGVYEWAIAAGLFTAKKPDHSTPRFIGSFTTASQTHHHYEQGKRVT